MIPIASGAATIILIFVSIAIMTELTWKRAAIGIGCLVILGSLIMSPYLIDLESLGSWFGAGGHIFLILPAVVTIFFGYRYLARRVRESRTDRLAWPDSIGQPAYEDACISYLKRHGWECSNKGGICGMGWLYCRKGDDRGALVLIRIDQMLTPVIDEARHFNIRAGLPLKFVCFRRPNDATRRMAREHDVGMIHYTELVTLSFKTPDHQRS